MDLVCLGELLFDMFPMETGRSLQTVTAFLPVPGGAPANVAVAASRHGVSSAFIGKVGNDPFGRRLASVLEGCGVQTRGMRYDPQARTTLNFIALPDPNTAEYLFYRHPGADMMLQSRELDRELLGEAGCFHFGSVSLSAEPCRSATLEAARIAREAGALVSFDFNYRPTLWKSERAALEAVRAALPLADVVKLNESELRLLSDLEDPQEASRAVVERGAALCLATLGPLGSVFSTRSASGRVHGFRVNTLDATGCGDAFMGALLAGLSSALGGQNKLSRAGIESLSAAELNDASTFANAAGALTATKKGVIPALPTTSEVEDFLKQSAG
jgi:fructokinase